MTPTHRRSLRLTAASGAALLVTLVLVASASAGDATLRATLSSWSRKIGADAHSVALAARRRHPRRMTYAALRFRSDALRALAVIKAQQPSSASGRQARQLALQAFTDYAAAGSRWAESGRARLKRQKSAARSSARAAALYAAAANRLLVSGGKLLR